MDAATITTILNNINSLYGNLVVYTIGLVAFVGAFVPTIISIFQRRQFTREYDELSKRLFAELRDKVSEAEKNLEASISEAQKGELEKIKVASEKMKIELQKEIGVVRASAFHLQANHHIDNPEICLSSCKNALPLYLQGDDERNARSILSIVTSALKKLNKNDLSEEPEIEAGIKEIIETLEQNNTNGRYELDISEINRLLRSAKKLEKPQTA